MRTRRFRIRIGRVWIDAVTMAEALDEINDLVEAGRGGTVFTPNVDHVVNAEHDPRLCAAYERADLAVADGQPLVWASRLLRPPLPERVAGSDLFQPLMQLAARRSWRVYLLGGGPQAVAAAAARLVKDPGIEVCGIDDARIGLDPGSVDAQVAERIRAARPHLVMVGLGAPKQEYFIDRMGAQLSPAVFIGVGATIDFAAGLLRRAPRWMRRSGLEWLFRLGQDPRRLARRYLWNDPRFAASVLRTLLAPRSQRVRDLDRAPRALTPG
jgi:N-acetylglucosaminyldiphosphoundecaprenol N-acetyl-beta-D-mannosaminyltransferase